VLRRIRRQLSPGRGVIVASELFGLAFAARHGRDQAVVQILHGDLPMYYALAAEFERHVDVFVAVSARIRDELSRRLPERASDIRHLPSGVPIPALVRTPRPGPLRLCYVGRLDRAKGVLDLPEIDRRLAAQGVAVRWTIAGAGPDADALRTGLGDERTRFAGALSPEATRALLPEQDVLVLPSRGEGLSLALLEAMAAGVVPVASDLPSGMREVIDPDATGLLAQPEHPEDFAAAIARLDRDRDLLERLSRAAAARIRARHALEPRARAFHELLADLAARPLPLRPRYRRGPSRLDRPWLPNALVRAIRRVTS
jgi:glycosyltransferase involved in cell wall biosynthesis